MDITTTLTNEVTQLHAELCSALADSRRIMIIYALADHPQTVNAISEGVLLSQPATSRHLKILREAGLVKANRQGANVEYSLADDRLIQALEILRSVLRDRLRHRANLTNLEIES